MINAIEIVKEWLSTLPPDHPDRTNPLRAAEVVAHALQQNSLSRTKERSVLYHALLGEEAHSLAFLSGYYSVVGGAVSGEPGPVIPTEDEIVDRICRYLDKHNLTIIPK